MKDFIKKLFFVFYPLVLYFIVTLAVELVMVVGFTVIYMVGAMSQPGGWNYSDAIAYVYENVMLINLITQIVCIPVMCLIYYLDRKKKIPQGWYDVRPTAAWKYLLIVPVAVGMCAGLNRVIALLPSAASESYEEIAQYMFGAEMWIQVASMVFGAGILEELLFRGILYKRLKSLFPDRIYAALLSAAIFGVIHGNLVQFLYAFCLGLILVFLYERYRSILAPMMFHMIANGISVYLSSDAGNSLLPLWELGPVYFIMMAIELVVAGLILKVIDNEVNPQKAV